MKLIEKNKEQVVFLAEIEDSLANALRRYLTEIPILAIDELEISKNDSALYDETIAHRLGLVPLKMDKSFNEKSSVQLKLNSKKEGYVYSGELKGKVKVVYEKIPVILLNQGQELDIVAKARVGRGRENSKFAPGLMYYRNNSEIIIGKELQDEIKKACPGNEIQEKGNKIVVSDNLKKEIGDICERICERAGKSMEKKEGTDLIITVESFGQLSPEEILKKAVESLKKDLSEVLKKVK